MSDRTAWIGLGVVVACLAVVVLGFRIPEFWGDGATYHSMAWSLAEDGDVRYEARDIFRVRREFPAGPQGVFLKRSSGGLMMDSGSGFPWVRRVPEQQPRIYYAKPLTYAAVAAPLVKLLGTPGLLLTNVLALGIALALGYAQLRRQASPGRALSVVLVLFLGTVAPLYLLWPTPEVFGLGLSAGGLIAWRWNRPFLAAFLLGVATYSKPPNVFLALPLGLEPLVAGSGNLGKRLRESVRRGAVLSATVLALYALNIAVTGEWNYQGGERKIFYGTFPFESQDVTFGNSGQWMTTDYIGPLVEGADETRVSRRTGPLRAAPEIRDSFLRNLGYFWIGRFAGAAAYFFPAVLASVLFLLVGPRDKAGWLALSALLVSYVFYIWMIPDNWYGGGGTVGNRYFLNLLPLALFMLPRGKEWIVAGGGALAAALFLGEALLSPLHHSLHPGDHATRGAFRLLPAELTMLNDLSVCTEPWRKKRPFGDTEGDPHRHWPADPKAYYLYFLDNGTFGKETRGEAEGFWLRGGEAAEVVLRALEPVRRLKVRLASGPAGDEVTVKVAGQAERISLRPGETADLVFEPGRGFAYYDTFLYVLRLRSAGGGSAAGSDDRKLGAFVQISLEVNKRPRPQ